jgi:hypothetical protein
MALDSSFCLAYDRRPMSFLRAGYNTVEHRTERSFHDIIHDLQALRLDWQTTSSMEPDRLLETETLDRYLNALAIIENHAVEAMGTPQQATQIPARIEQLVYELHVSYLKAQVLRLSALSSSLPIPSRLKSFEQMKTSLRNVVSSFMTLKQLSAVPNVAWDVQQAVMSSALILAGLDRALETKAPQELLEKLARILPHCSCSVTEDETETMMEASYCHGLEALKFILNGTRQGISTSPMS